MESRIIKRNVALVEKCTMSSVGIKSLFNTMPDDQYKLHLFSNQPAFSQAMLNMSFSAVIFSLSAIRTDRRAGLTYLTELAINYPRIRRVVIADDDAEARLIGSLSPLPLDGVVSKASSLTVLQDALFTALSSLGRGTEGTKNHWYINQSRMLSPTEREILRFMSNGYSMPQIAVQLERNIKTIRAHKFNVMSKLGVSSDAGLLDAADILLYLRAGEPAPFMQAVS
ncbi:MULTISPECIES: DNA-binding transcriptional activator BglJ [unclassified Citrobacter]|uniref:DNA-binding transcriptional activator BglJ n=1 Tax=unclassified Citrobacter TaxID=2644389 RepID=UPI00129B2A84|nr:MULTISPECIES: DNA-binding transcriptional activator BglJ [unclassified Citrobacter]